MHPLAGEGVTNNRHSSDVLIEMDSPPLTPSYNELSQIERRRKALPSTTSESDRTSSGWLATVNRRQQVLTILQKFCRSKAIAAFDGNGSANKLTETVFYELFSQEVCSSFLRNIFFYIYALTLQIHLGFFKTFISTL